MKWKIKKSKAKSSKKSCVIKIKKNNLFGDMMVLSDLGNNEFEYRPSSVGIYRVMHNVDTSANAIKGCQLVYKLESEDFFRRLSITDEEVRGFSDDEIQSKSFVNQLGITRRANYQN